MTRALQSTVLLLTLAAQFSACEKTQQASKDLEPAAQRVTKKADRTAKSVDNVLQPAASSFSNAFETKVLGQKKGGGAGGKAVGRKPE
jgi:hypothetical protein